MSEGMARHVEQVVKESSARKLTFGAAQKRSQKPVLSPLDGGESMSSTDQVLCLISSVHTIDRIFCLG